MNRQQLEKRLGWAQEALEANWPMTATYWLGLVNQELGQAIATSAPPCVPYTPKQQTAWEWTYKSKLLPLPRIQVEVGTKAVGNGAWIVDRLIASGQVEIEATSTVWVQRDGTWVKVTQRPGRVK